MWWIESSRAPYTRSLSFLQLSPGYQPEAGVLEAKKKGKKKSGQR
jgi:hypothetical protein